MNKDIRYTGLSAVPSDYDCPDGHLAVSLNLINEDGALTPVESPVSVRQFSPKDKVFIHETTSGRHYIIYGTDATCRYVAADDSKSDPVVIKIIAGVTHFNAVGNTLLVFTPSQIHYFLWRDSKYTYLGDHIPELDISFGLVGHPRLFSVSDESKNTFVITFDGISESKLRAEFTEDNKTKITDQVMPKVNKFIRQQTIEKGRFCFPFFVRYAIRLYDGSLVNHSAPILMNPSTTSCPVAFWRYITGGNRYTQADIDIMIVASSLDYRFLNLGLISDREAWSDIIAGIDVFISKPIYTYDQDGKFSSWNDRNDFDTKFIGRLYATNPDTQSDTVAEDRLLGKFNNKDFLDMYAEWDYGQLYAMYFNADRRSLVSTLHFPEFSDKKVADTISSTSTFYKLCTLSLDDLFNNQRKRTDIVIEDDYLQSLVNREVMTDDYLTHDTLAAGHSHAFNSRLNLSGVSRKPFRGFLAQSMFAYCDSVIKCEIAEDKSISISKYGAYQFTDTTVTVYIKENGRNYAVSIASTYAGAIADYFTTSANLQAWGCYVFYPNVNAFKMVITNSGNKHYIIDLKPHDFLNGAYALLDYNLTRLPDRDPSHIPVADPGDTHIQQPSKIYTSEVNNPFYFPLKGINTVGTGRILGISSAARALSQGQFGQFPLYAFTDSGVWALELTAEGLYSARQPITRDVCTNPDGITQIDSAVLFPTDRGIMIISGSQTQCISEAINSEYPFDALSLPGMDKLHSMLGHDTDTCLSLKAFSRFLKDCGMLYDYTRQRIIVYNKNFTYAYIYSLKTKLWGMMHSRIESGVNSYPHAMAVDNKGRLISFNPDNPDNPTTIDTLLVTRPVKLDAPDIHKTIDTVIHRGFFRKGHVATVLYGSRDLINWHLVWSSKDHCLRGFRGTPYKYFRFALLSPLSPGESISGASVQFTPRLTNRPR